MTIYEKLGVIQAKLKAPKSQFNDFGKYKYRSCEDVLEAVKPLLTETKCVLLLKDAVESAEGRVYIRATAQFFDTEAPEAFIEVTAYAREEETKKGMDASQVTGTASSYARKYALNGLFCIDDAKDSDFTNQTPKETPKDIPMDKNEMPFCAECGARIDDRVFKYSMNKYGRPLCRGCQK